MYEATQKSEGELNVSAALALLKWGTVIGYLPEFDEHYFSLSRDLLEPSNQAELMTRIEIARKTESVRQALETVYQGYPTYI